MSAAIERKQRLATLASQKIEDIAIVICKGWKGKGCPSVKAISAWIKANGLDALIDGKLEEYFKKTTKQ